MLTFHNKYKKDTFSQNGEQGIIDEILSRLNIETGLVVEFGAADGEFCSNSRHLILKGWQAILIEADKIQYDRCARLYKENDKVSVREGFVIPKIVNAIIPDSIDVLSIDVDGIDAAIWDAYQGDAKVVIIEINSSLPPLSDVYADPQLGTSYKMMWRLGLSKGYFLLVHCGNLVFVKLEYISLFPELEGKHPIKDIDLFFNKSWQV